MLLGSLVDPQVEDPDSFWKVYKRLRSKASSVQSVSLDLLSLLCTCVSGSGTRDSLARAVVQVIIRGQLALPLQSEARWYSSAYDRIA